MGATSAAWTGPKFWGLGKTPKTAKEWRETSAVLDEWNHDTFLVIGRVAEAGKVKACTGKISEQLGKDIPDQYLAGGTQQAIFEMSESSARTLAQVGNEVIASGATRTLTLDGIEFTLRPTGWTDANGVWGYLRMPGPGTVQTARLGTREQASKDERHDRSAKP